MSHAYWLAMAGWVFSAAMSTMPDLPPDAGWSLRWLHDFAQALGANINKIGSKKS